MDNTAVIKIGPVGRGGEKFWDEKGCDEIVQIFIGYGDREINSIQFQYYDENGTVVLSKKHGGGSENNFDVVRFNYPSEYLTRISGHTKINFTNRGSLTSLSFGTNQGTYGPFGCPGNDDKEFRFGLGEERQFFGFYGTTDYYCITSIGVYLKPSTTPGTSSITHQMTGWEI